MDERMKKTLSKIINDKYSVGAFSGMIFNTSLTHNRPIKELVEQALLVRLTLEDMSN